MAEQKTEQAVDTKQLLKVRREKLAELQANGQNPFEITKYDVTIHSAEIKDNFEALESKTVRIAGRMMSKRVMLDSRHLQRLPGVDKTRTCAFRKNHSHG